MSDFLNTYFRIVEKFAAASAFGVLKFVFVFAAGFVFDNRIVANFIVDGFVVQLFSNITAIGFAGILLTRIPKCSIGDGKSLYIEVLIYGFFLSFLAAPLLFALKYYGFLVNPWYSIVNLFALTSYLIVRHYFQARLLYIKIILLDILSFFLSLVLAFGFSVDLLLSTSFGMLGAFFIFSSGLVVGYKKSFYYKDFSIAFHNGISTCMTSWPFLFMPAALLKYGGADLSAYIGLLINYLNVAQMIIRSLMFDAVVSFAKASTMPELKGLYTKLTIRVTSSTIVFASFAFAVAGWLSPPSHNYYYIHGICVLFSVICSQYTAAPSCLILAKEKTQNVFKVNLMYTALCIGAVIYMSYSGSSLVYPLALMIFTFIRAFATSRIARNVILLN